MRWAVVVVACLVGAEAFAAAPASVGMLARAGRSVARLPSLRSNLASLATEGSSRLGLAPLKRDRRVGWMRLESRRMMGALRGLAGLKATATAVEAPVEKFRKDYKPTDYVAKNIDLTFQINDGSTKVLGKVQMSRQAGVDASASLRLDAEDLDLRSVKIDGKLLPADRYWFPEKDVLEIKGPFPGDFELETEVIIKPEENFQLSGLYKSSGMYCTQCEAEGFRRITPMMDRPDAMALYKVRLEGDKKTCPVLLSNGNLVNKGDLPNGRHFTEWVDPFKKPTYLFAVVAGDLGSIKDSFTTKSGRKVALEIFSEHGNVDQLDWAMQSLKDSMKWDEDVFGLEYDLDVYNIVAVGDFNMGAMENKGLNVFNTACVLAKSSTATDGDFERVQGVIAHEYFHNWTGNRVTCRDWFQLTLKEGLTVFRDQQFSADMTSAAVQRIENVRLLRAAQFPQDNGPMAHPIRPESYIAMDNFYTATVYNKGAEVIGMYQTLLGKDGFRKGMDLYFKRHDGGAVTCDDFRAAMADANGADLAQFEKWYTQAGTPTVKVEKVSYDAAGKKLELTLSQKCGPSPGQPTKEPYHIPVRVGLLGKTSGKDLVPERVLELRGSSQTFTFKDVSEEAVLSVLRGFSAPVKLEMERSDEELAFLMANDSDDFNRWEAGQTLFTRAILSYVAQAQRGAQLAPLSDLMVDAVRAILKDEKADRSLRAYALALPSLGTLGESMDVIDPDALIAAVKHVKSGLAAALRSEMEAVYKANHDTSPSTGVGPDAVAVGKRRLKNTVLDYMMTLKDDAWRAKALEQALNGACMTDVAAGTMALADDNTDARGKAIGNFYDKHAKGNDLILCKWFTMQAVANVDGALEKVDALLSHPDFTLKNPNKCRALVSAFAANMKHFHAKDGKGYKWLADRILEIDKINPQNAARMCTSFSTFRRYDSDRQKLIKAQLERLLQSEGFSKDAYEIVAKSLKA
jgi:aminopeptidase N